MDDKKGFTLVEMLVTIGIIGLILGIAGGLIFNVINSSKDTTEVLTEASVKKMGSVYINELPEEVTWADMLDGSGNKYACVLVSLLIERGYLERNKLGSIAANETFVKVVKGSNSGIVSEEIVDTTDNMCKNANVRVLIPKSKDVCTNFPTDELKTQLLINDDAVKGQFYVYENQYQQNAGSYPIEFGLNLSENPNYVWSDGTRDSKTVVCTIKKKVPEVGFVTSFPEEIKVGSLPVEFVSNVEGKLYIKISNPNYVTLDAGFVKEEGIDINADETVVIPLNIVATRGTVTYITATVVPDDSINYYVASDVFVIDVVDSEDEIPEKPSLKTIPEPTPDVFCNTGLFYDGSAKTLTKDSENWTGYTDEQKKAFSLFNNTNKTNPGSYTVTAKITDSNYMWEDETVSDKEFKCTISEKINSKKTIPVPTAEDFCKPNLIYNGKAMTLTKDSKDWTRYNAEQKKAFSLSNNTNKTKPGNYIVTAKITDSDYMWEDGTITDKEFKCKISKKTIPIPTAKVFCNTGLVYNGKARTLTKDSKNWTGYNAEQKKAFSLSNNTNKTKANSYTVTAKITDSNYMWSDGTSTNKTFDCKIERKSVPIPTAAGFCKADLVYDGTEQTVVKAKKSWPKAFTDEFKKVFKLENTVRTSAGTRKVTAKLTNSNYMWNDKTILDKTFDCEIAKRPTSIVLQKPEGTAISSNLGSVVKTFNVTVPYIKGVYTNKDGKQKNIAGVITIDKSDNVGVSSLKPHEDYNEKSNSLYTAKLKGLVVGENHKVVVRFTPKSTNYAASKKTYKLTVVKNEYKLTYDAKTNGGTGCTSTKKIYYKKAYGDLCKPTKKDYEFMGWYTSASNRNTRVTKDTVLKDLKNKTIYAHFSKKITLTLYQLNGTKREKKIQEGYKYNKASTASITMPNSTSYKNSSECGTWDNLGWTTSKSADASVQYKIGSTYSFKSDTTLYARYSEGASFIYDYNGGVYIPSRHETMHRNAYSLDKKKNIGPWYETVDVDASRSGWTFIGWYEGSTKVVDPGESKKFKFFCDDYMISAQWQ